MVVVLGGHAVVEDSYLTGEGEIGIVFESLGSGKVKGCKIRGFESPISILMNKDAKVILENNDIQPKK